ncbi:hypothetical protein BJAS_P1078 [Bathymodiolus japonicus methanotrophic gill symbiont]|uniref:BatD family protein n=1 Tax=Bathymodiolus japonicus methanotrophic gill symbiont TaxID=113269 RepID=UPI001B4F7CD4|nr:BatD family protein [Bathymodiolus japonicus methanotrophic gill symbiont]GFO71496.1 hypothetical protein BJAS_P1078 [Bathymodiolus japonicus methanotrophic gill symbiont]
MIFFNKFRFFSLLLLLLLNLAKPILAADISVSVDRNPVNLQESFQLTFTANDDPDGEPDFAPLEKDFDILNQSKQQSVQIINWEKTKSIQWVLTVMAKREGSLVIPAINFGQDSSQFAAVIVNEANNAQVAGQTNEDLVLQVEVDSTQPYIQEQVIYTLKLLRKVNISQASLTEPELQDAVIEKLGEDKNYNTRFQGEDYVVTERKYAIFPQKSGTMTIQPLTLTAEVILPGQRRMNSFFNRQRTRTKRVVSNAVELTVKAKPAGAGSNWLPAKQIALQEKWTDQLEQIAVGQPITRTITLYADGATVGVLPELFVDNMLQHLKAYPDQPVLNEEAKNDGVLAFREEKIALIPGQTGSYTLPAIEIPWWNTNTRKMEIARIPERTITAIDATDSAPGLEPIPPIITPAPVTSDSNEQLEASGVKHASSLWFWLAIFFAGGWLLTLVYFLSRKKAQTAKRQNTTAKKSSAEKDLQKACAKNASIMAKDALFQWGREQFKQSSLSKIAEQCEPLLQAEILALNTALYSAKAEEWQGEELWEAFQKHQSADVGKSAQDDPLQPLFNI